jgi:hypothetical protein
MITVKKDNWTLQVEWFSHGLEGINCIVYKDYGTPEELAFPVVPFITVRPYTPASFILDEERDMPTKEEAKEWLNKYIEEIQSKHLQSKQKIV